MEEVPRIEPTRNACRMAAAIFVLAAGAGLWWIAAGNNRAQTFRGLVIAQLKDGSAIKLDSLAQSEVLPGFGNRQRLVKLTGKAVFDVTPDAVHPFIVKLGEHGIIYRHVAGLSGRAICESSCACDECRKEGEEA